MSYWRYLFPKLPKLNKYGIAVSWKRAGVGLCVFCGGNRACPSVVEAHPWDDDATFIFCLDCGTSCRNGARRGLPEWSRRTNDVLFAMMDEAQEFLDLAIPGPA